MASSEEIEGKLERIRSRLAREPRVRFHFESPTWSLIQGLLSRGDRRLGGVLAAVAERGNSLASWRSELRRAGIETEKACRSRSEQELLPWGHLGGVEAARKAGSPQEEAASAWRNPHRGGA